MPRMLDGWLKMSSTAAVPHLALLGDLQAEGQQKLLGSKGQVGPGFSRVPGAPLLRHFN